MQPGTASKLDRSKQINPVAQSAFSSQSPSHLPRGKVLEISKSMGTSAAGCGATGVATVVAATTATGADPPAAMTAGSAIQ